MNGAAFRYSMLIVLGLWLAACGHGSGGADKPFRLPDATGPDDAIIFGSIVIEDKDQARRTPDNVRLLKKGKVYGGMGLRAIGEKTALFYGGQFVAVVKSGDYILSGFYSNRIWYQMRPIEVAVGPGQIFHIGSFEVRHERDYGPLKLGESSVARAAKPSERELLQWLATTSEGTAWDSKVRQRAGLPPRR
jgi:hypothetical protein